METETVARLLRSARALARRDPEDFAVAIDISVTTLKRVEAGYPASGDVRERVLAGLREAGFEIVGPSRERPDVVLGIVLLAGAKIGPGKAPKATARPTSRRFKRDPVEDG